MHKKYITILLILIFIIQWGGGNPSFLAESYCQNYLRSRAAKETPLGDEMASQISGAMHTATGEKQLAATKLITVNITDSIPQAETARILVSLASLGHSSNKVTDIIYLSNVITADMPSIIRVLEEGSELEAAYVEMQEIKNEMINNGIMVIVDLFQSASERVRNGANSYTSEEVALWEKNREKFIKAYNAFKAAKNRFDSVKSEIQAAVEKRSNKSRLDYAMPEFLTNCSNAMSGLDAVLEDRIALMQGRPSDSNKPVDMRELLNPETFFAQLKCTKTNPERIKQFEIILPKEPVMVKASRISLLSLLCNLADNAYRYAEARQRENAKVIIKVAVENGEAVLSVKDNGEGISAEGLRNIQQVFFTTRDTSMGLKGIGLTESRIFVKEIGGSIVVQSEAGNGSTFIARLPAATQTGISGAMHEATQGTLVLSNGYEKKLTGKNLEVWQALGRIEEQLKKEFPREDKEIEQAMEKVGFAGGFVRSLWYQGYLSDLDVFLPSGKYKLRIAELIRKETGFSIDEMGTDEDFTTLLQPCDFTLNKAVIFYAGKKRSDGKYGARIADPSGEAIKALDAKTLELTNHGEISMKRVLRAIRFLALIEDLNVEPQTDTTLRETYKKYVEDIRKYAPDNDKGKKGTTGRQIYEGYKIILAYEDLIGYLKKAIEGITSDEERIKAKERLDYWEKRYEVDKFIKFMDRAKNSDVYVEPASSSLSDGISGAMHEAGDASAKKLAKFLKNGKTLDATSIDLGKPLFENQGIVNLLIQSEREVSIAQKPGTHEYAFMMGEDEVTAKRFPKGFEYFVFIGHTHPKVSDEPIAYFLPTQYDLKVQPSNLNNGRLFILTQEGITWYTPYKGLDIEVFAQDNIADLRFYRNLLREAARDFNAAQELYSTHFETRLSFEPFSNSRVNISGAMHEKTASEPQTVDDVLKLIETGRIDSFDAAAKEKIAKSLGEESWPALLRKIYKHFNDQMIEARRTLTAQMIKESSGKTDKEKEAIRQLYLKKLNEAQEKPKLVANELKKVIPAEDYSGNYLPYFAKLLVGLNNVALKGRSLAIIYSSKLLNNKSILALLPYIAKGMKDNPGLRLVLVINEQQDPAALKEIEKLQDNPNVMIVMESMLQSALSELGAQEKIYLKTQQEPDIQGVDINKTITDEILKKLEKIQEEKKEDFEQLKQEIVNLLQA